MEHNVLSVKLPTVAYDIKKQRKPRITQIVQHIPWEVRRKSIELKTKDLLFSLKNNKTPCATPDIHKVSLIDGSLGISTEKKLIERITVKFSRALQKSISIPIQKIQPFTDSKSYTPLSVKKKDIPNFLRFRQKKLMTLYFCKLKKVYFW